MAIIWQENPKKFEYLRVSRFLSCHPSYLGGFKTMNKEWKVIGFTKAVYKGGHLYEKFFFWLKNYDRGMPDAFTKNGYGNYNYSPCEAVDVKDILKNPDKVCLEASP